VKRLLKNLGKALVTYKQHAQALQEIDRLQEDCSEFYQVIGALAFEADVFDHAKVTKALDNAIAAASGDPRPHSDLLPFDVTTHLVSPETYEKLVEEIRQVQGRTQVETSVSVLLRVLDRRDKKITQLEKENELLRVEFR